MDHLHRTELLALKLANETYLQKDEEKLKNAEMAVRSISDDAMGGALLVDAFQAQAAAAVKFAPLIRADASFTDNMARVYSAIVDEKVHAALRDRRGPVWDHLSVERGSVNWVALLTAAIKKRDDLRADVRLQRAGVARDIAALAAGVSGGELVGGNKPRKHKVTALLERTVERKRRRSVRH